MMHFANQNSQLFFDENKLYTGDRASQNGCQDDSGRPLQCPHYVLTWIVSFEYSDSVADGWPSYYTRVEKYVNCIYKNIGYDYYKEESFG